MKVSFDAFPTSSSGVAGMCEKYGVDHLGTLTLDPLVGRCVEEGRGYGESGGKGAGVVKDITGKLLEKLPVEED